MDLEIPRSDANQEKIHPIWEKDAMKPGTVVCKVDKPWTKEQKITLKTKEEYGMELADILKHKKKHPESRR